MPICGMSSSIPAGAPVKSQLTTASAGSRACCAQALRRPPLRGVLQSAVTVGSESLVPSALAHLFLRRVIQGCL